MDRFKQHMEYKAHEENAKDMVGELGVLRTEIERLRKEVEKWKHILHLSMGFKTYHEMMEYVRQVLNGSKDNEK